MIRKALVEDAYDIEEIRIKTWRTTYKGIISDLVLDELEVNKHLRVDNLRENLKKDKFLVYLNREKPVGFIGYGTSRENDKYGEIFAIYILEDYQSYGYGKALIHKALLDMPHEKLWIWSLKENPSLDIYRHLGGKIIEDKVIKLKGQALEEVKLEYDKKALFTRTALTL